MAYIPMIIGKDSGIKTYTESSFNINASSTYTITVSDMKEYISTSGYSTWTNQYLFFHSDVTGDITKRNSAWETSASSYLHITISGNQVSIRNGSSSRATVTNLNINYC